MTDKQDGYPNLVRGQKGIVPAAAHNHVSGRRTVVQELNDLLHIGVDGAPRYTVAELEEVVKDPTQPPSRILAARRVLSACRDGRRSELLRLVDKHPQLVAMLQMKSLENQIGKHEEDSGAD
jgi:hypothetical protein